MRKRNPYKENRTLSILPIIILSVFLLAIYPISSEVEAYSLEKVPFPSGTYIIPMDEKQVDILRAYGFAHALLRNGTTLYRIIQPPDITLTTELHDTIVFKGGPFLIWDEFGATIDQVKKSFPTVTLDRIQDVFVSESVMAIEEPTRILIIKGNYNWGKTEVLLDDMEIPYEVKGYKEVESNTKILDGYNLVVDDCSGWWRAILPPEMISGFQEFVSNGGNLIFTDKAISDAKKIFPGYLTTASSARGSWKSRISQLGEPLSQYSGPLEVNIFTEGQGIVIESLAPDARALLYSEDYDGRKRILAAYFYYGKGLVAAFGYHPQEQSASLTGSSFSYIYASILYGNMFISGKVSLPPSSPPEPLPIAVPPPPTPPPPPPPPIPTSVAVPAGYIFAGALPLGLISVLKSKLKIKLKAKQKIAIRAK